MLRPKIFENCIKKTDNMGFFFFHQLLINISLVFVLLSYFG